MNKFDIAIIGGGPGGYVTAIKAGQMGRSVVCVDNSKKLGGTCLNVGCIPSKALLNITHKYCEMLSAEKLAHYGISCNNVQLSLEQMMVYKNNIIADLAKGIQGLFKKNKVTYTNGTASFVDAKTLNVRSLNGDVAQVTADHIIIATGSSPMSLPNITIDEKRIVSSTGALSLQSIPKKMVVIGAGVIGLELGSVWQRLGSDVTIIEYADAILGNADQDISNEVQKILTKEDITFITSTQVTDVTSASDGTLDVKYKNRNSCENGSIANVDIVLVAVGRKPNISGLGLDKIGVVTNKGGQIVINEKFETNINGIYAIGDVIAGPMLAHKASEEGIALVEMLCSEKIIHIHYDAIPNIVYTSPEIAIVGRTERQLQSEGTQYKVGKFPFIANSRAKVNNDMNGFVKIMTCAKTDTILGAAIIHTSAGEMVHELVVAMGFKAASEDIAMISHGHPTLSEAIKEAMMACYDKPIHM